MPEHKFAADRTDAKELQRVVNKTHTSVKDTASLRHSVCEAAALNSSFMRPEQTCSSCAAMTDRMHLHKAHTHKKQQEKAASWTSCWDGALKTLRLP